MEEAERLNTKCIKDLLTEIIAYIFKLWNIYIYIQTQKILRTSNRHSHKKNFYIIVKMSKRTRKKYNTKS